MIRRNQWRVVGAIYVIGALLWLSSCDRLDVDVDIEAEVPGKTSGIDRPATGTDNLLSGQVECAGVKRLTKWGR